MDTSV